MRRVWLAWGLVLTFLAGCAGGPQGGDEPEALVDEEEFNEYEATATTGVIRGVVIDEAIRPIAGATITLMAGEDSRNTTSADSGAFGFSDLAPGTYFMQVNKTGFAQVQASADVVAGVGEPEIVKVVLSADPTSSPFVEVVLFEGFIECSVRAILYGVAVCDGIGNDNVEHIHALDRVPTFVQGEMVWDSTQALGDELSLNWRKTGTNTDYIDTEGPSPLLLKANQTLLEKNEVGIEEPLRTIIFTGHNPATEPPGGITWGVGVQLKQQFTVYIHIFYNMVPPEEWRFTIDGDPPMPP